MKSKFILSTLLPMYLFGSEVIYLGEVEVINLDEIEVVGKSIPESYNSEVSNVDTLNIYNNYNAVDMSNVFKYNSSSIMKDGNLYIRGLGGGYNNYSINNMSFTSRPEGPISGLDDLNPFMYKSIEINKTPTILNGSTGTNLVNFITYKPWDDVNKIQLQGNYLGGYGTLLNGVNTYNNDSFGSVISYSIGRLNKEIKTYTESESSIEDKTQDYRYDKFNIDLFNTYLIDDFNSIEFGGFLDYLNGKSNDNIVTNSVLTKDKSHSDYLRYNIFLNYYHTFNNDSEIGIKSFYNNIESMGGNENNKRISSSGRSDYFYGTRLYYKFSILDNLLNETGIDLDRYKGRKDNILKDGTYQYGKGTYETGISPYTSFDLLGESYLLNTGIRYSDYKRSSSIGKFNEDELTYNINYTYYLTENSNILLSYNHLLKRPNIKDYSSGLTVNDGTVNNPDNLGNPMIKSEKIDSFDLGYQYEYNDLNFRVGGFYKIVNDFIGSHLFQQDGRFVKEINNIGTVDIYGGELEFSYTYNNTHLYSSLTLMDGETDANNRKYGAPNIPNYVVTVGVEQTIPIIKSIIGMNYNRVGNINYSSYSLTGNETRYEYKDVNNLDAYVRVNPKKNWYLTLSALNLLDENINESNIYVNNTKTYSYENEGRKFTLSVEYIW